MSTTWAAITDDHLEHIDKAVEFLQTEFSSPEATAVWSTDYFHWKIGSQNIAGRGYVSLAMVEGRVVGITSITKKRVLINGTEVIGGEVGDAYSSPRMKRGAKCTDLSRVNSDPQHFINRSVFGRLASDVRTRAEADGISLIYGTPNKNAYPGWVKRLGYFELEDYNNQAFSRPTWRMILKKYPHLSFAGSLLRMAENTWVTGYAWLWQFTNNDLVFDQSLPPKDEINQLWLRTKPTKGFSLVRDADYWEHRYSSHPLAEYTFFSVRRNGILVAIITTRLASINAGKPVLSIVEWMADTGVPFDYLLAQVIHAYKGWCIDVFTFWINPFNLEAKAARRNLFVKRGKIPIIFADSPQGDQIKKMVDEFHFFLGSTDAV